MAGLRREGILREIIHGIIGSFLCVALVVATATEVLGSRVQSISALEYKVSIAENIIRARVPANSLWSFSAVSFNTGEQITRNGNGKSLMPASLVKLIVTAAALDANVRERISLDTVFAVNGRIDGSRISGDLYIKGYGNAFLSEDDIKGAVEGISSIGIGAVSGDVVVDDYYFDVSGWERFGNGPAYAVPGALGLDLHTVSVRAHGLGDINVTPAVDSLTVAGKSPDGSIHQVDDLIYMVPEGEARGRFALNDPAIYAGSTFRTLMNRSGVAVEGEVRRGRTPSTATELHRVKSKPLPKVIRDTNAYSLNVAAENLLLLLGAKKFGFPGTLENGIKAVKLFLEDLGLPSSEINISDGSGLSKENMVTAEFMARFLERISREPWFDAFYKSLPKAGLEGTLRDIGYSNEKVRAKTGQTESVYSLAGYADGTENGKLAFSLIVNVAGADLLRGLTGTIIEELAGKSRGN